MSKFHWTIRILFTLFVLIWAIIMTLPASAAELVVTRYFSGLWDQPKQESQGIVLQIVNHEEDDGKKAVAYWFTYGDNLSTAWYVGIGHVEGDSVPMTLYSATGLEFMEDAAPGNAHVFEAGSLILTFRNCNHGVASFDLGEEGGSGEFEIKRLAGLYNSRCSGGISDDTPNDAKPVILDVDLDPAREGITGKGKARFWQRVDRMDFHVSAEDIPDGPYDIMICNPLERVGSLLVNGGEGATQFRSPEVVGQELLSFDPRDCLIELHDASGAILTSGEDVLAGKENGSHGNGKMEIAVELNNTGLIPGAEGEASYLEKNNSIEFEVEIKGVPAGSYPLWVGGELRGQIIVAVDPDEDDDKLKGKLRFSDPQKDEREFLDFDPRGLLIEVYNVGGDQVIDIIFEKYFPE